MTMDFPVARQFLQTRAELRQRDIDRARNRLDLKFRRIPHIEQELAVHRIPVADRHVAAKDIGRDHPRKVDGILCAPVGRRIAEFGLFQVVNGAAHLDRHREGIDPLGNAVLTQHLRAEQASVGFPEQDLDRQHLGAG